jgi:glycerol-3-phosphate dehydrogenase (NAD(P)+)
MRIAVLGAGAWGSALAIAFSRRHAVCLWAREAARVEEMSQQRENRRYLPGCGFPAGLQVAAELPSVLAGADLAILAAPLAGLRPLLLQIKATLLPGLPFLWVCKGLESGTGLLPHQVVAETIGEVTCGVLTGPSFALEVARGLPTAVTLAAADPDFAETTAQRLHGGNLRIYANQDLIGAEVGGAVKNVLAIATGICDGLGLGLNARAALITRGLAEITRFGVALGARHETFMGLAGMGDVILTCTGELSRNRSVGLLLAQGRALDDIHRELGHVAEGVPAAREVVRRAREFAIDMPIAEAVTAVLDGRITPRAVVEQLMARDQKHE